MKRDWRCHRARRGAEIGPGMSVWPTRGAAVVPQQVRSKCNHHFILIDHSRDWFAPPHFRCSLLVSGCYTNGSITLVCTTRTWSSKAWHATDVSSREREGCLPTRKVVKSGCAVEGIRGRSTRQIHLPSCPKRMHQSRECAGLDERSSLCPSQEAPYRGCCSAVHHAQRSSALPQACNIVSNPFRPSPIRSRSSAHVPDARSATVPNSRSGISMTPSSRRADAQCCAAPPANRRGSATGPAIGARHSMMRSRPFCITNSSISWMFRAIIPVHRFQSASRLRRAIRARHSLGEDEQIVV